EMSTRHNKYIGQSINAHINEKVKEPEFDAYYTRAKLISEISQKVYELRISAGLSQKEIAKKAHTTQPVIARLESGKDSRIPSLELLAKIAHAANKKLDFSFF
uniref:helix-turn-helix transcriptional regulator n=1 Tax=Facilibium subflavum TaxID=2219058 RepID=UPI001AAD8463